MDPIADPAHPEHDPLIIARHAAGDLSDTQASAASSLLVSCRDCADLHRELVAIAAATRALPRSARAPRDFRITAEQASSLRRGSWLRALLRPFASARSAARPMATAFTSLGVAGLLVAAFVPGLTGGAASAPTSERNGMEAMGAAGGPTAAAADDSVTPMAGAPQAPGASSISGPADLASKAPAFGAADGDDATGEGAGDGADPAGRLSSEMPQPNLLVVGSLALLLVGLAIFGLRAAARRVR